MAIKLTNLKSIRKGSGLTQEQAAKELGISLNTYRNWEQRKSAPDSERILRICSHFGCTLDELVGRVPAGSKPTSYPNNIRELRTNVKPISQHALAEALGISESALQNYEYGNRRIPGDVLAGIAAHFSCTTDEVLGLGGVKQEPQPVSRPMQAETELLLKAMEHFVLDAFTSAEMSFDYPPELLHEAAELGKWLVIHGKGGDDMTEAIGKRIAELREAKGWTARQLARKADLADDSVISIEEGRGNPTVKTLEKIAEALGCTVGDLVG